MRRHAPNVHEYMTRLPVEAERCERAGDAVVLMEKNKIHHLPVMNGSHLRGIVSLRHLLEAHVRLGDRFADTQLDQLCPPETLTVSPVDPIDEVASRMLESGVDGAAVVDRGFVVGVFTAADALRFLRDFFGQAKTS